jgi:hypothetical protein
MNKKTLKKEVRLQSAKSWILKYNGMNPVKGYRKQYGVSLLCAAEELRMLGIAVSASYISQLKIAEENTRKQNALTKQLKDKKRMNEIYHDSDETFYFIAGYTSGGVPYGISWDEVGTKPDSGGTEIASDILPF